MTTKSRMSTSIYTKLNNRSRSSEIFKEIDDQNNKDRVRDINTLSKFLDMGLGLKLSCVDCGHEEAANGNALIEEFGGDAPIREVRPSCSSCGSKSVSVMPG